MDYIFRNNPHMVEELKAEIIAALEKVSFKK
jgi:heme oxygenase